MVTQDRENDGLAGMACWKELIARPVKDMAKNFNIDVDHILKNYLDAIDNLDESAVDNLSDSFQQDMHELVSLNFGEAAMIVQNSASIYSKKVDLLQKIFDNTLRIFRAEKKGKKIRNKNAEAGEDGQEDQADEDEDIMLTMPKIKILKDGLRGEGNLDPDAELCPDDERSADAILAVKPSILLSEDTAVRGIPLKNTTNGDTIGYYRDFYCNRVHLYRGYNIGLLDDNSEALMRSWEVIMKNDPRSDWLPSHRLDDEEERLEFQANFQKDDDRFKPRDEFAVGHEFMDDDFAPPAPVEMSFAGGDYGPDDAMDDPVEAPKDSSFLELQEKLAPVSREDYKNLPKVQEVLGYIVPKFDEFKTQENQAETTAGKMGMLKPRPIIRKKSAIVKFNNKTYSLWKAQQDVLKAKKKAQREEKESQERESRAAERATENDTIPEPADVTSDRSTLEKSANATANQTSLEPKQKSKAPANAPIEPISNFIDKMRFKHLRKLPNAKSAIHAVTYPELKDWFFKEVDRRKREEKSRRARPKSVRRKLKLEEVIPKPGEKRGLEELASVDACPDALEEDAVQTLVDRIERYDDVDHDENLDHGINDADINAELDFDMPGPPPGLDDSGPIPTMEYGDNQVDMEAFDADAMEMDFENLVRHHVDEYFKMAQKFAKQTDLDKRVREWQDRLEPILDFITGRGSFDLHKSADTVIGRFGDKTGRVTHKSVEKTKQWTFVTGGSKYEACTLFASMLQLANNGNIEIITDQTKAGTEAYVNALKLKLLTSDRLQDRFDEMDV